MDLDQLHTFLEIVRLKSFSKAALGFIQVVLEHAGVVPRRSGTA